MRFPLVHTAQGIPLLKHVLVNHPLMFYPVTLNLLFKLDVHTPTIQSRRHLVKWNEVSPTVLEI
jgi:hypothetical protein